jgi:hypothetical protein
MNWNPQNDAIWTPQKELLLRIRKYRDIWLTKHRPFVAQIGLEGFYRLEAVGHYGARWLTPWFHNRITDAGLDLCTTSTSRYNACQVGTGTAAPTDADTGLQAFVAGTTTKTNLGTTGSGATPPWWTESYYRYDFATGAIAGQNIAEIMIGTAASAGSCYSRELIRDGNSNPTTIQIQSTEALRVHHRLRQYAPTSDVTGAVNGTILGVAESRNFTRRARSVGLTSGDWRSRAGSQAADLNFGTVPTGSAQIGYYTGSLVAATSGTAPSGSISPGNRSAVTGSYSAGSRQRVFNETVASGNAMNNIKTLLFSGAVGGINGGGSFQVEFDVPITKGINDILITEYLISWGRYSP